MRVLPLLWWLSVGSVALAAPTEMMRYGRDDARPRAEEQPPPPPKPATADAPAQSKVPAAGTNVRFFGHAFLYMTTAGGVRIAFNPFPNDPRMGFPFPVGLPVDVVLISSESADMSGSDGFSGLPQVFRSITGIGVNNANGVRFRGIAAFRDDPNDRHRRGNTIYVLESDRVIFCVLGDLGHPLDKKQEREIGRVDALFLPIGNKEMSIADLWKIAAQTRAKWVVPVMYRTDKSPFTDLRTLAEFLDAPESVNYPRVNAESVEFNFRHNKLPAEPTLLIYPSS